MIRAIIGTDTKAMRVALAEYISAFRARYTDSPIIRFDPDHADGASIADAVTTSSLFGDQILVVFDGLGESAESLATLLDSMDIVENTQNDIVFLEVAPKKELRMALEKVAGKAGLKEYKAPEKAEDKSNFLLGDALVEKDKKRLWMLLVAALKKGKSPEELHGTLWWSAKTLYIALRHTMVEAKEAGISEYSFRKAERQKGKWSAAEVEEILRGLKDMVHERGVGSGDIGLRLEKFVLEI